MEKINIEKIKKFPKTERKTLSLNIRITPTMSKWLNEKGYSPTGIFMQACKSIGYRQNGRNTSS